MEGIYYYAVVLNEDSREKLLRQREPSLAVTTPKSHPNHPTP